MDENGRSVSLVAHGKVNLLLAITGRRPDGYHTLYTVMQSIGLGNRLTLCRVAAPSETVRLSCDDPALPTDRRNTAVLAAELFLREAGADGGLEIRLEKRIPYQAGLGSASADAAGVLAGANALFGAPLALDRLLALAARVGADVPFCLTGGICRAEGIGERLTPLPALPPCALLIAKPPEGISTPEAYARFDRLADPWQPDGIAFERALEAGNLDALAAACGNAFSSCCPVETVTALAGAMREAGALGAAMSGSGTAVFGLFREAGQARFARGQIEPKFAGCRFFVTQPANCGITWE